MLSLVPQAMAQVNATAFGNVVDPLIKNIVDPVVELIVAVALVMFVWGIIDMIIHADDAEARGRGSRHMLAGLVGIVIMVCAWGIIVVISNTVGQFK